MNAMTYEPAADAVKTRWPDVQPKAGMILGSGWSEVVEALALRDSISYSDIPGLGKPGVAGHAGRLARINDGTGDILIFQGRRHYYEGEGWSPIALPIGILKACDAPALVLTNAAGGIRDTFAPGDLMIIRDHINFMGANPLIGPHNPSWGPRFPDQSMVYNEELRAGLYEAGRQEGIAMHEGVYLAGSGPTYETPAEIRAFQALGADAVGMSTVPEAILANAAGLKVAGLSCISNLAAGMGDTALTHKEVTQTTQGSMDKMKRVVVSFLTNYLRNIA
jgi:purine-nucleoside phosphorylase